MLCDENMTHRSNFKYSTGVRLGIAASLFLALTALVVNHARAQLPFGNRELGNDHGLTDLKGKELLPPIYAGIRYLGHGLFLLKQRCPEPEKRFDCAKEKILLNNNLKKVKTSVPSGASFERILWLGKHADESEAFITNEVPEDALLVYRADECFGVCSSKGRAILPPDCVWIGNLSDGVVALRKSDGFLYTFNFEKRKLQKLAYQKVRRDCRLDFSEGLAEFASQASPQCKSMWGFIDTSGNVVIEPKFDFAWNFEGGVACVRFPANGSQAHNELIDRTGKLASPHDLKVIATLGPYIEVQDQSGNFGVVDHSFKYVIPPKYKSICAQTTYPDTVDEIGTWYPSRTMPIYYFATRDEDGKPVILSAKGDLVLTVPPGLSANNPTTPPIFVDGLFACKLGPGVPFAKATFINFKGELVPAPYSNLSDSKEIVFRQIAPGILLKTLECKKELRAQAVNGYQPGDFTPKDRTLREYVCYELKAVVDDFDNGRYNGALLRLQKANLDERRDPIYQPVFIRGLCLQAMGKFTEAAGDYAVVNGFSNDQLLKDKSQIGLECCSKKQSAIPSKMLTFPPRWERQGGVGVPIPFNVPIRYESQ